VDGRKSAGGRSGHDGSVESFRCVNLVASSRRATNLKTEKRRCPEQARP
jgi:hypothetical protein